VAHHLGEGPLETPHDAEKLSLGGTREGGWEAFVAGRRRRLVEEVVGKESEGVEGQSPSVGDMVTGLPAKGDEEVAPTDLSAVDVRTDGRGGRALTEPEEKGGGGGGYASKQR